MVVVVDLEDEKQSTVPQNQQPHKGNETPLALQNQQPNKGNETPLAPQNQQPNKGNETPLAHQNQQPNKGNETPLAPQNQQPNKGNETPLAPQNQHQHTVDDSLSTQNEQRVCASTVTKQTNNDEYKHESKTVKHTNIKSIGVVESSPQIKDLQSPGSVGCDVLSTLQTWVRSIREHLLAKNQAHIVQSLLSNCKTDEDRVSLMYNLPIVHEILNVEQSYKQKSEDMAKDFRLQGNEAFRKKKYDVAVQRYSESILMAPSETGSELSLAFANRSAVLYHQQEFVLCLQDIKQALKFNYPKHLKYKLYERRGKASYSLRLKENALSYFQEALIAIEHSDLEESKLYSVKEELAKQLKKCETISQNKTSKRISDFNHNHSPLPHFTELPNFQIPCMANSLEVKYTEKDGRGLYATKDIEVGEVLILEKPYTSIVLADYNLSHCHHCCSRVVCPLPCHQCSGIVYCSELCQQAAWQSYHYAECKYHDLIQKSGLGMGHLALRMVLKAGFQFLKKFKDSGKKTFDVDEIQSNEDGMYNSDDYRSVYNLIRHTEDRTPMDLFRRTICAVFLLKCLEKTDFFAEVNRGSDILKEKMYIGGHILRHVQMLPCNAHEVTEFVYKKYCVEMSEPEEVGSAIYATLSLINHSCDPSIVRHSYGNKCVVRAIRNISKGEEVFDNYGVLYPVMSKAMRQEKLLSQYFFSCHCHACSCNWPMYDKIPCEFPVLKCKKCHHGRIMIPADNQTTRAMCEDCRYVLDITPDLLHLSKSEHFYQGSLDKVLKGEERCESLDFLVGHLRLIDRLLVRPWKDHNDCQEAVKQCYSTMGNCRTVQEPDSDDEELMESKHC